MTKINKNLKIVIIILIVFLIIIIAVISETLINKKKKDENTLSSDSSNNTSTDESSVENEIGDMWEYQEKIDKEQETYKDSKLDGTDDLFTYFLIKQCLSNYCNVTTRQQALNIIDEEAKKELNINENNVQNLFNNYNNPEFCIDKIYKQGIDTSKTIYVVYYRIKSNPQDNNEITDSEVLIKIDAKNVDYSIYPLEYVKKKNYTELKKNDSVQIENMQTVIKENDDNKYKTSLISKEDKACLKELFERLKFDVKYDNSKLYGDLNSDYKKAKFADENSFSSYLKQNYDSIVNSEIKRYKVNDYSSYKDYIAITGDSSYLTFSASSMLNYTVMLDDYTIITKKSEEAYESAFVNTKAKYCIRRVIKALNEKDYEFVYNKLDVVQKNNIYRSLDEFIDFVNTHFYNKSNVEIGDDYLKVTESIYQYDVKITDLTEEDLSYRNLVITVTVEEGTDFSISINEN